jgi:hypothetical protein
LRASLRAGPWRHPPPRLDRRTGRSRVDARSRRAGSLPAPRVSGM